MNTPESIIQIFPQPGAQKNYGNLLPNNQRQRRTCYALCHILYPVSAALASFFRMDSISTSFTFSFDLRNRAHFLPPRPVDSTAYLTPPSWHSMARANPLYRSVHRPPAHLEPPKAPAYRQSTRHCLRAIPCPLRQKPTRTIAQLSLQRRFPRAGKPEGPHVDDERPRRKSPSTEARCPAQHTSAPRHRLALSDSRSPHPP